MGLRKNEHSDTMDQLTLKTGEEDSLLARAEDADTDTQLVVAPVKRHQRNIQRRLRELKLPKDAFIFHDLGDLSKALLAQHGTSTEKLDRIDRLAVIRSMLTEDADNGSPTLSLPVGTRSNDPQYVEQIRADVENVTNWHPERIDAWEDASADLPSPTNEESIEILETACDVERLLREQTTKAISDEELVRRATRTLAKTDGAVWEVVYPDIEQLSVLGLSSLSATQLDFVQSVIETTSVDVHIYFRTETGEFLQGRVDGVLDVSNPGFEVFE